MILTHAMENMLSTFAEPLRGLCEIGPAEALVLLFAVVVTAHLFVSRVRRCRRGDGAYDLRDFTALVLGPVVGGMIFLADAALAAASFSVLDLDSDHPLRFGLQGAAACIWIGLFCFLFAVVGILWPVAQQAPGSQQER